MKLRIDRDVDALYLRLDDSKVVESEEVAPGVIVDFDSNDRVVGVEVLDVSQRAPKRKRGATPNRPATLVREKPARKYRR